MFDLEVIGCCRHNDETRLFVLLFLVLQLEELFEEGFIDEDQYERRRKIILAQV